MRRWLYILIFVLSSTLLSGENYHQEHENILSVQYGGLWQQDQYFSPLVYSGQQVGLRNEWWQQFQCDKIGRWQHVGKAQISGGMAYSKQWNNSIYSIGLQGGWGVLHTWKWQRIGLQAMVGPHLNINLIGRMHTSIVNNPFSMDLGADICAMGGLSWAFKTKKTSYRLRYIARVNAIGVDYMPDYWQSYYEQLKGVPGQIRCSGVWNHRHLQHELTFDMQLKRSTWRVGVAHEYLEYGMSKMMFSQETVSAILGCIWQYKINPAKSFVVW